MVARDFGILLFLLMSVAHAKETIVLSFIDSAKVNDTCISILDIATISGPEHLKAKIKNINVGHSAPAGYSRFALTSEVVSTVISKSGLNVIASPNSKPRILISTKFLTKKASDFKDSLDSYIYSHSIFSKNALSISLINANDSVYLFNKPYTFRFSGVDSLSSLRGHVRLMLFISQQNKEIPIPILCLFKVTLPVCISKTALVRSDTIKPEDILLKETDISFFTKDYISDSSQLVGKTLARSISNGSIFCDEMLATNFDIEKGKQVIVTVVLNSIKLSVPGIARESGLIGSTILVENSASHKIVKAKIMGKTRVSIITPQEVL